MDIKKEIISAACEQYYFTFSKRDVNQIMDSITDKENMKNLFLDEIKEIINNNIDQGPSLIPYVFKPMSKIEYNQPLVVLVRNPIIPENIPVEIPDFDIDIDENEVRETVHQEIIQMMFTSPNIQGKKVDAVSSASIVYYEDIETHLSGFYSILDREFENFKASKIGDVVEIDNQKLKINEAYDYSNIAFNDLLASQIDFLGITSMELLIKAVNKILFYETISKKYIAKLFEYYKENKLIEVDDEVLSLYSFHFETDDKEVLLYRIYVNYICAAIIRDYDIEFQDHVDEILEDEMELFRKDGIIDSIDVELYMSIRFMEIIIFEFYLGPEGSQL